MATTYTGTPVLNTSITIPQDGDNANAASGIVIQAGQTNAVE